MSACQVSRPVSRLKAALLRVVRLADVAVGLLDVGRDLARAVPLAEGHVAAQDVDGVLHGRAVGLDVKNLAGFDELVVVVGNAVVEADEVEDVVVRAALGAAHMHPRAVELHAVVLVRVGGIEADEVSSGVDALGREVVFELSPDVDLRVVSVHRIFPLRSARSAKLRYTLLR